MKGVAIVNKKGGVGKTSLAHALALGAAWRGVPAYLMHTDNREPIQINERPYAYYDAREPHVLTTLIGAAVNQDGLCIIDSGGNRPEFDRVISECVDLAIIPVTPDPEAVDLGLEHYDALISAGAPNVKFLLNMVSSNAHEKERDRASYFSRIDAELILGEVPRVAAVKRLRENDIMPFKTPPTNVNNLARLLHRMVDSAL